MKASSRIAAFGYHEVTDDPTKSGFQRDGALPYTLGRAAFAAHLDRIGKGLCIPTLVDRIDPAQPGRQVLLTFDDGGKSALYAGEELCRRGWHGHFFIVTSLIGRRTFLSQDEIRHLRSCGHLIGSHSHTHPDIYRDLTPRRMAEEWQSSRDILAQILGEPCIAGAVPGGDISGTVLQVAGQSGLRYLFTSEPQLRAQRVGDCWVLGRVAAKRSMTPEQIERLAQFRGWTSALLIRRLKTAARRSVPPLYRLYVNRSTRQWQGAGV